MARDYDPTVKVLVETSPSDWLVLDGQPRAPVTDVSAEITTVLSAAADRFLRVEADPPYIHHLEFQSGHDTATLPGRLHLYNGNATYHSSLPVRSVVVVLRPEADSPQLTGVLELYLPGAKRPYLTFEYGVLRVWEVPAERFLEGGPGTVPLAPLGAIREEELPALVERMERRLRREQRRRELWTAARILMGMRYPADLVDQLLRGITEMKESTTYQAILAEGRAEGRTEGRVEEARRMVLLFGEAALGPADRQTRAALNAMSNLEELEDLARRAPRAASWADLLGRLAAQKRGRRKTP
jgi:predicted transposase YdaD